MVTNFNDQGHGFVHILYQISIINEFLRFQLIVQ